MHFLEMPIEQQIDLATRAARAALDWYDLGENLTLEVLKHRENTVLAIVGPSDRKLGAMRVHVPGYQDRASIESELAWMRALASVGVQTPAVIPTRGGVPVVSVSIPGTSESRLVDVLEWIEGRQAGDDEVVDCFRVLGDLHARCHDHASRWQSPPGFVRQRWDETTLLTGLHPTVAAAWDNWALTTEQRRLVLDCRDRLGERLARWGKDCQRYGIIHSDLMPDNLILAADGVRLIDFDDAGFGWYLYDPASALLPYYGSDLYEPLLASWLDGYRNRRSLPDEEISELPAFLLLRCFYALGWLHLRRNSQWARAFIEPVLAWTTALGRQLSAAE